MKLDVQNETFIFKLSTVCTYDGTAKKYEELAQYIQYYPPLNVRTYDGTTKQDEEKHNKYVIMKKEYFIKLF